MHVIKRLMMNTIKDNTKILTGQIFDIRPRSASRDLQTRGVHSNEEWTVSPVRPGRIIIAMFSRKDLVQFTRSD